MRLSATLVLLAVIGFSGCTSFKTTSLFRKSGHKLVPQKTNAPLKGLPVKMKVPSHVNVAIYEQQLILAANSAERATLDKAVSDAEAEVQNSKESIALKLSDIKTKSDRLEQMDYLRSLIDDNSSDDANVAQAKKLFNALLKKKLASDALDSTAIESDDETLRKFQVKLSLDEQFLQSKKFEAEQNYRLVSFNPPQYIVESEIQYTDKVFLVDFKRPAGGVLDVTSVKMDDEQYFADVQAKVTERTVEDISSVLAKFTPKASKALEAKPTSADTPESEANSEVHFQKSVVAMKRFDISQQGWEQVMMHFVNGKLQGTDEVALRPSPQYMIQSADGHGG